MRETVYPVLADIALMTHIAFVSFVVLGLVVIVCGGILGWRWVRNPWFRALHLGSIGVVVLQAWFGIICPITTLEMYLREKAGESTYDGTFVSHWLHKLLYFEAPSWVFAVSYTVFGIAVVVSWLKFRPRPFGKTRRGRLRCTAQRLT